MGPRCYCLTEALHKHIADVLYIWNFILLVFNRSIARKDWKRLLLLLIIINSVRLIRPLTDKPVKKISEISRIEWRNVLEIIQAHTQVVSNISLVAVMRNYIKIYTVNTSWVIHLLWMEKNDPGPNCPFNGGKLYES